MSRPTYSVRISGYWDNERIIVTRTDGRTTTDTVVTTWADGYGTWHARFVPSGNRRVDAHIARLAIGFELNAYGPAIRPVIRVTRTEVHGGSVRYSESD